MKDYKTGGQYKFYVNTLGADSPMWVSVAACGDLEVLINYEDVEVPINAEPATTGARPIQIGVGHLSGVPDHAINLTLYEDAGDDRVESMIDAVHSGELIEIAVARGIITQTGVKHWRLQSRLAGERFTAERRSPATWQVTAKEHALSTAPMTRLTTP
jgi:hypothetical protein